MIVFIVIVVGTLDQQKLMKLSIKYMNDHGFT